MTTTAPLPPRIDYLTKDFNSFRRLMLDRLAVLLPTWSERHAPDMGMVLLDILAYSADYLSYDQDAVATEAYLGTARRRISVRRHARLLDHFMHDGCNARVFVVLEVAAEGNVLPAGTPLLTRAAHQPPVMKPDAVPPAASAGSQVFETMHAVTLRASHNSIALAAAVPAGATSANLVEKAPSLSSSLAPGQLLLFEEIIGSESELPEDANPDHRQVVRLTSVTAGPSQSIVTVEWWPQDALSFPLVPASCVARGNVVLADHGQMLSAPEALPMIVAGVPYRPVLARSPITQQGHVVSAGGDFVLFDPEAPASAALAFQLADVRPAIRLTESAATGAAPITWSAQRDLLSSDAFATDFVVEIDDAGSAHLRFGDDVGGKSVDPGSSFQAVYRTGNGLAGNVGAESIAHVVPALDPGILGVRNPLPAAGGIDPETVTQVQRDAPQAFRVQQRAVTRSDHVAAALQFPGVKSAVAELRWTGSYHAVVVTVQRAGGLPVDAAFQTALATFLDPFRLAGWDIEVRPPTFVPIALGLAVAIAPGFLSGNVLAAVARALGTGTTESGQPAFFNPDSFTFGQAIYFSRIVGAVMAVPGVAWVDTFAGSTVFTRVHAPTPFNLATAVIQLGPTELPSATITLSIAEGP